MSNELTEKKNDPPVMISAEALISQGIDKGLSIDGMERLLKMRTELKSEYAREEFARALSAFQSQCPVIGKGSEAKDKDGKVRYRYAALGEISEAVAPLLEKNGLSYTFKTKQSDKSVTAICIVKHLAGHAEETEFEIPIDPKAYMNEAQKVASALTYAKRYAFMNAFGIMTGDEDDDGNATGAPAASTQKKASNFSVHPKNGKPWSEGSDAGLIKAYAQLGKEYQEEIGKVLTARGFSFEKSQWVKMQDAADGPAFGGTIVDAKATDVTTASPTEDPYSDADPKAFGDEQDLPLGGK